MIKNKKSQFLILSAAFIFLLIAFIYSAGTQNFYITKNGKYNLLNNIVYETCKVGKLSNGSYINSRYLKFSQEVYSYCLGRDINCSLSIINNTQIPPLGNWSLLNYSDYNYSIYYDNKGFIVNYNFTC